MACVVDMYNNSSTPQPSSSSSSSLPLPMSPRISFSNDFVESHNFHQLINPRSEVPVANNSSDFEFSVSNYNMLSADELFCKGRLLPFKDNNNGIGSHSHMQRTLRDELLVDDDFSLKPPKSSSSSNRWKGFLGLRKSHIGSKKPEKTHGLIDAGKRFSFAPEDPNLTKSPQDMVSNEGPSSSDMEMGI